MEFEKYFKIHWSNIDFWKIILIILLWNIYTAFSLIYLIILIVKEKVSYFVKVDTNKMFAYDVPDVIEDDISRRIKICPYKNKY